MGSNVEIPASGEDGSINLIRALDPKTGDVKDFVGSVTEVGVFHCPETDNSGEHIVLGVFVEPFVIQGAKKIQPAGVRQGHILFHGIPEELIKALILAVIRQNGPFRGADFQHQIIKILVPERRERGHCGAIGLCGGKVLAEGLNDRLLILVQSAKEMVPDRPGGCPHAAHQQDRRQQCREALPGPAPAAGGGTGFQKRLRQRGPACLRVHHLIQLVLIRILFHMCLLTWSAVWLCRGKDRC